MYALITKNGSGMNSVTQIMNVIANNQHNVSSSQTFHRASGVAGVTGTYSLADGRDYTQRRCADGFPFPRRPPRTGEQNTTESRMHPRPKAKAQSTHVLGSSRSRFVAEGGLDTAASRTVRIGSSELVREGSELRTYR